MLLVTRRPLSGPSSLALGALAAALVLAGYGAALAGAPPAATSVFVNEVHYDNSSDDVGEAIEIAGPAGTDLAGWSLVLYNGSNNAAYNTRTLSGVIPNQQGGFGTLSFSYPTNGIQNGAPDGLALVNAGGAVVQFLSYEGAFTASGGPADGMTSTDIGVAEPANTPVGFSLQLTGSGTTYADFAWTGPADDSFGAVNAGQTFEGGGPPGGGDPAPRQPLVVNEVDYDQPGTDRAEFVELYNAGSAPVDLDPYALALVNGNGAAVYRTVDLPAVALAPGAFFVVCTDAASVARCDLDVAPDADLIQNGAPDAVALVLDGEVVDALSYEGRVDGYAEGAGSAAADSNDDPFVSLSRLPDGADTDDNAADFALRCGSPGAANRPESADCLPTGPDPLVRIHDVQGSGATSPLVGRTVTVEGVVGGDFQSDDGDLLDLSGFFVQEEEADRDADPATSEGLFVFTGSAAVADVALGDVVRVSGTVREFGSSGATLTQIADVTGVTVVRSGPAPAPVDVALPLASPDALERVEGMRVRLPQGLVISESVNFDRFGELVLALPLEGQDRLFQPTAVAEPGPAAAAVAEANRLRRITLDDGRAVQNPDPARHPNGAPFTLDNRFRSGDAVRNAVGVLDERFGIYRLQPTGGAEYVRQNPRPDAPEGVGGTLTVASFNVLNYFHTLDNAGRACGPDGDQECRGADDAEEFGRQRAKVLSALAVIDADVAGLVELENTADVEPLADLVAGLNERLGAGTYAFVETGVLGTDAIRVGLIYKPGTVTPVGDFAALTADAFVDPLGSGRPKNRPALAQTFREEATGETFTVVVNHLRSKGGSCGSGDDDPQQGACNATRAAAADVLLDWIATDPTGADDPDYLVVGDLNAYDEEDPIGQILEGPDDEAGTADDYTDLVERASGEFAYSYGFDGQFGYLDYALASGPLAPQVTGATVWHVNADEPDLLDYDTQFKKDAQDALYEPNAYRSADHDPVVVGLALTSEPQALACSPAAPLSFTALDVDGQGDARGEFAALTNGSSAAPVLLDGCDFIVFDPFTERVTYAADAVGPVPAGATYSFANNVAGGPSGAPGLGQPIPPNTFVDAPGGAFALIRGSAAVGDDVLEVLEDAAVVAAVVYLEDETEFASVSGGQGGEEMAQMLARLLATIGEGDGEVDLRVVAAPNPAAGRATVSFGLAEAGEAEVALYDALGRRVAVLAAGPRGPGRHAVPVPAASLPAGVYVVRVAAGPDVRTARLTIVR